MRRIRASAVTVLPQPLSPTSPSVSPGRIAKLVSSTARARPSGVSKLTHRFFTSSSESTPDEFSFTGAEPALPRVPDMRRSYVSTTVSYTHLRAHETPEH